MTRDEARGFVTQTINKLEGVWLWVNTQDKAVLQGILQLVNTDDGVADKLTSLIHVVPGGPAWTQEAIRAHLHKSVDLLLEKVPPLK